MAIYISSEYDRSEYLATNAGGKARADVTQILTAAGLQELVVPVVSGRQELGGAAKLKAHVQARDAWWRATQELGAGDVLVLQFPLIGHSIFFGSVIDDLHRRGVKLILFIHDLDSLRALFGGVGSATRLRLRLEEERALTAADVVVVHNEAMAKLVTEHFKVAPERLVTLGIFDYLVRDADASFAAREAAEPVALAGNLSPDKCAYLAELPADVHFALYGGGYGGTASDMLVYHGVVDADLLPEQIEGGFGLVWDGTSAASCTGPTGRYLTVNNPHKTSLYLAAGLPVIIWDKAALAPFVLQEGCGATVASLYELRHVLDALEPATYAQMVASARRVGVQLRAGAYTRKAIETACALLARSDSLAAS